MDMDLLILLISPNLNFSLTIKSFNAIFDNVDKGLLEFGGVPLYKQIIRDMHKNIASLHISHWNQNAFNMNKLIQNIEVRNFTGLRLGKCQIIRDNVRGAVQLL
ncbi:hypothetical protein D3C74_441370 [compost metagenome]